MITPHDKEIFQARGILCLKNFLPKERVRLAHKTTLKYLYTEEAKLTKRLPLCPEIANLLGEEVYHAVTDLLEGQETFRGVDHVQILFTPQNTENWTLPHKNWHIDFPLLPEGGIPGIQIFTFLERVIPTGGGTLVVAGSHRFVNESRRIRSQEVRQLLKREPYFDDLLSGRVENRHRFLQEPTRVGDIEVQVVELHGDPGDVYFMDVRLLHTFAPNASPTPRIMLVQRYLLPSASSQ